MRRSKRIYILLGVLVVICLATFAAVKLEDRQERIQTSEAVILELASADVQQLSWSYDETTLSFTRDDTGVWRWDEDDAFPVSEDKMNDLLKLFSSFGVSFIIEDVEDYSQYGLDAPVCTIELTTVEQSYTLELGSFSKLDQQRYVSIGDGNAYLVSTDPMDTYEITIRDMIEHDEALDYDTVTRIRFSGAQDYTLTHEGDDNDLSICADDVYFTDGLPLDTALVKSYLNTVSAVGLTNYVSYNATQEELETYGLNDPELTVVIDSATVGEDDEVTESSYTLHISRSAEQRAMTPEEEEDLSSWVAYARVGESQILYQISSSTFEKLMAAGYDDLRHREVFTADSALVTSVDITLEGSTHSLTTQTDEEDEDTLIWLYGETEIEVDDVLSCLEGLSATEFTDEQPAGQQEIQLTLHLDLEFFPEVTIALYRYDGSSCLATVDGESFALVPRSDVVDLIEAVNAIILN